LASWSAILIYRPICPIPHATRLKYLVPCFHLKSDGSFRNELVGELHRIDCPGFISYNQLTKGSLSNEETEVTFVITKTIVSSFQVLQQKLRDLSNQNLKRLQEEEKEKSPFCKHKGRCSTNCLAYLCYLTVAHWFGRSVSRMP
jgi:hypothetical protein